MFTDYNGDGFRNTLKRMKEFSSIHEKNITILIGRILLFRSVITFRLFPSPTFNT